MNRKRFYQICAVFFGLFFGIFLIQIGASFFFRTANRYCVFPPNLRVIFKPNPEIFPGIASPSRFYTNSFGIRGDEFSSEKNRRILAIGGSTTECLYLDQSKSWPHLLQDQLNGNVWVGNVGKSGMTSRDHIMHMTYLLSQYPHVNTVLMLVGINDLMMMICDPKYDANFLQEPGAKNKQIAHAFSIIPLNAKDLVHERIGMIRLSTQIKELIARRAVSQDQTGKIYRMLRENRKNAKEIVNKLPDMTDALAEYRRNLNAIVDLAQKQSVRLIFLTQPTLWKNKMAPQETALLWKGKIGADEFELAEGESRYYAPKTLLEGMNRLNSALKEVGLKRHAEIIDLASLLPKNASIFYDDVHFTDEGSKQVAAIVFNYLKNKP